MSVATPPLVNESLADLSTRVERILADRPNAASWWVELVATLDAMTARLSQFAADPGSRAAFADQLRLDAPHLFGTAQDLDEESDALSAELINVRIAAGMAAGDTRRAAKIRNEVGGLLGRLRRLERRANSLMFDAYDRDIGGE